MKIRDRIVGLRRVPARSLRPHPKNWRLHPKTQKSALRGILEEVGYASALLARQAEDGSLELIDGHLRAETTPDQEVPVLVLDVTKEEAEKLLASMDPIGALAGKDEEILRNLLQGIEAETEALKTLFEGLVPAERKGGRSDPDAIPEPPAEARTRPGDLYRLGEHRLLCGDSGSAGDVDRLLGGAPIHLVNMDPPYNVRVEPRSNNAIAAAARERTHHQSLDLARHPEKAQPTGPMRPKDRPLENDFLPEEEFQELLLRWFGNASRVLVPGRSFYIWGGYANLGNYPQALKASGLYFSQAVIWVKEHPVMTRKDFMGNHEWCQPAETKVLTPAGTVPIGTLRDGDRVVGYATAQHRLTGRRQGQPVRRATRPYVGELLGVRVGRLQTWATPNHLFTAKLAEDADRWWCVYLMRRGRWWRIGKSRVIHSWGFGLKHRVYVEGGEEAWILSVHPTNGEALVAEQAAGALYGIPTTVWSRTPKMRRTMGDVRTLYDHLDLDALGEAGERALLDHGRSVAHPCVTAARSHEKMSRRVPFRVRGSNLLPGLMLVPVPARSGEAVWTRVDAIERAPYRGMVHSLEVTPSGHYVADGIVTHNCLYGWKEGAAHYFHPTIHNATDVWSVKKVSSQKSVHLTEKPVELAARAMEYSSRRGENVLDLFGGSGSTLIAAEQAGRRAFLVELDALYCDVIVARWEGFTGKKAEREAR